LNLETGVDEITSLCKICGKMVRLLRTGDFNWDTCNCPTPTTDVNFFCPTCRHPVRDARGHLHPCTFIAMTRSVYMEEMMARNASMKIDTEMLAASTSE
jgi:hypothetical protein